MRPHDLVICFFLIPPSTFLSCHHREQNLSTLSSNMMFKSLVFISVLTSTAFASTTNVTTSTSNPLIPDDTQISGPCNTFLNTLNSDTNLGSCLSTLKNITSAFAPGASTPSQSDATPALNNLCADSVTNVCPESLIRQWLTSFFAACPAELTTNPNTDVIRIYDVLYDIPPLHTSVCSKDNSGNYCVNGASQTTRELNEDTNDSSLGISDVMALLYFKQKNGALTRRDQFSAILPNTTTFSELGIPFGFLTPDLNETELCVSCTRQILTAYINFESSSPYVVGINSSQLLSQQSPLFNAVQSKCNATFLSGAVAAAGGLSGDGTASSSAISTYSAEYQRVIALVVGVMTLIVSVAL